MIIERIILREIRMPLVAFFQTSFGKTTDRRIVLIEVQGEANSGWGEVTAPENPFYNEETTETAWHIIKNFVAPPLLNRELRAREVYDVAKHIRGHNMARGGVEAAMWDLEARINKQPLWRYIGGTQPEIACGVSIGIQNSVEELLDKIAKELSAGYQRIKIKIKPDWDVGVVARVRERFPAIRLMADANSAYSLADAAHLKRLDDYYLMMIEQPLAYYDLYDHARLQENLATPICLDECIRNAHLAAQAAQMNAGRIINIKLGRVGGFSEARRVHDVAQAANIPVWCGGMLEAGIGRAHNIALSTLPNFVLPGDVSASKRYWKRDIITPPVEVSAHGTITASEKPGIGYDVDVEFIDSITARTETVE